MCENETLSKFGIKDCLPSKGPLDLHEIDRVNHLGKSLAKRLAAKIEWIKIKDSVRDTHFDSSLDQDLFVLDFVELVPPRKNFVSLLHNPFPGRRNGVKGDGLGWPGGLAVGIDLGEPPNGVGLADWLFHGFLSLPGPWHPCHSLPTFLL